MITNNSLQVDFETTWQSVSMKTKVIHLLLRPDLYRILLLFRNFDLNIGIFEENEWVLCLFISQLKS